MLDDRTARISAAVDKCLGRLDGAADPKQELQAFMAECQGKLPDEELRTVVFRIILDREQRRGI